MKKHTITLVSYDPDTGPQPTVLCATDDDSVIPIIAAHIAKVCHKSKGDSKIFFDLNEVKRGRKGTPVYIVSKAEDCEIPVDEGMILNSASELGVALGVTPSMVTTYLRRAKEGGDREATIKGVNFCYLEDWGGDAKV